LERVKGIEPSTRSSDSLSAFSHVALSRTPSKPTPPRGTDGRFEEKPKPGPVKFGANVGTRTIIK